MTRTREKIAVPPRIAMGPTPAEALSSFPYLRLWNAAERLIRYTEPHDLPAYVRDHYRHLEAAVTDAAMKSE